MSGGGSFPAAQVGKDRNVVAMKDLNRLGEFLRARRERIRPEDHGLPVAGRRRTPGLRREEIAMLADVSTDYYIRLEQGRERNPSPEVIEALARALLMDEEAVAHLRDLARRTPVAQRQPAAVERVSPNLMRLMDRWPDTPALVLGRRMDVLAANALGDALFSWLGDRNIVRALFLDPAARAFYADWERTAENCVASLRASSDGDLEEPRLVALVGELSLKSPDFARLWARHDVRAKSAESKIYHHPLVGDLELTYESFTVTSAPGQQLALYNAEPGSPSEHGLMMLASLAAEPSAERAENKDARS